MKDEKRLRLGELLIRANVINQAQLEKALSLQPKTGKKIGKILIETGAINEKQLCETLGYQLGVPFADLENMSLNPSVVNLIPQRIANKYSLIAFEKEIDTINVAMVNPLDVIGVDDIKAIAGLKVKAYVSVQSAVEEAISKYYRLDELIFDTLKKVAPTESFELIEEKEQQAQDEATFEVLKKGQQAPIVKLVDFILTDAIKNNASDIHIEPQLKGLEVRYRLDGILHERINIPKYIQEALISRTKIISGLDIAEKRRPQDGRAHMRMKKKDVDLRISIVPTIYGEKVVIRILDKSELPLNLENLDLDEETRKDMDSFLHNTKGIIFVTGPTGSGKTTTLYASINQIKSKAKNIVTVEDPVEYAVEGINQIQVNERVGVTFASALRSVLRQDPDVILVGEVRDNETARIAFESALTGHLVLSTVHTNSAPGCIVRLLELGVEHYLINEAVIGVIAQRLLRRLCENCKKPHKPDLKTLEIAGLENKDIADQAIYRAVGCDKCNNFGYKGRIGIFEILKADEAVRTQITSKISESSLMTVAKMAGMKTLKEKGIEKVFQGITTFEEVLRVTYEEKETIISCPSCGKMLEKAFSICPYCKQDLNPKTCKKCGKSLNPVWQVCPYCRTLCSKSSGKR